MAKLIFLMLFLFTIISCENDKNEVPKKSDARDSFVGIYKGIEIESGWTGVSGPNFYHDTSLVDITVSKASLDSIVVLKFSHISISPANFSFKYFGDIFISTNEYHPPQLRISHDSLFFYYRPSLGPWWIDCIVKKQ